VEVAVIIVVIAIVASAAMGPLTQSLKSSRERKTEREMRMLQNAIAGDPSVMSVAGGVRSDFGYVGDVGDFPPDLDALVANPGGFSTWNGPYIPPGFADDGGDFKTDEWGTTYTYHGGLEIVSYGSGKTLRKGGSENTADYLSNTVYGMVRDVFDSVPAETWMDSVDVEFVVPDGTGGLDTMLTHPDSAGEFAFSEVPIGKHLIRAVFIPELDTLIRLVTVVPRQSSERVVKFNFAENHFSPDIGADSMLTLVEGSQQVYGQGSDCNNISFDIRNNTGDDVDVTSVALTWSSPVAFYQEVWWGPDRVWMNSSPRNGSGDVAVFSETKTITFGSTATLKVEIFRATRMGNGAKQNMSGTTFTVLFSDGSTFEVTMGSCN